MASNALLAAIGLAAKKNKQDVHKIPAPKEPKSSKGMAIESGGYYFPPSLYLSTEDFPGVSNWKVGDTVHLAITAKVKGVKIHESAGEKKKHHNADLVLTQITDVTPKAGGK